MNQNHIIAYDYLSQAQQALKAGDRKIAQEYCDLAKQLAPDLEEVWLLQASLATPQESIAFLEKAFAINPGSERAKRGMVWAQNRLQQENAFQHEEPATVLAAEPIEQIPAETTPEPIEEIPAAAATPVFEENSVPTVIKTTAAPKRTAITVITVLVLVGLIFAGWFFRDTISSSIHILLNNTNGGTTWSDVDLSGKGTATDAPVVATATSDTKSTSSEAGLTASPVASLTATSVPTDVPSATTEPTATEVLVTVTPNPENQNQPSPTPLPTDTSEPTFEPYETATVTAYEEPPADVVAASGEHWIDVNLSQQMVYAYEGENVVNSFIASTGTWQYPTVTGQYNVYLMMPYKDMSGDDYYLPDVPNTMFFYEGYAIHGTYWHSNFGTPMSHGCVNLSISDSDWVYQWASVGTLVNVH
jgi:lipoprotein-anchoring transpeptidase ErfK/SrfK